MTRPQATAAVGLDDPADPAVPLTLLTGFLGAGKTTLVNRVLSGALGGPMGVLVNDFGAVDIDRALVAGESRDVLTLVNGCICCSLRDDLVTSVMRLLQGPDAPSRVLLEASGVADPVPIASTFLAPAFRHRLRLDGIVCVVDSEQALADPDLVPLQLRQIGYADLVILNKADLAGPARLAALAARIRAAFSGARLVEAAHCDIPAEVLFSAQQPRHASGAARLPGALMTPDEREPPRFDAWSFETAEAFCRDALHDLARRLPPSVYRAKGLVRLSASDGRPDRRGVLQIVGRRADLVADRAWRPGDDPSRLVFIGAAGKLHSERLAALVRACLRPET
ncbi:MAG TPA: GTP-binding protein [Gammaproteobacteria bacterium]|nr:GTP-binding protein [Gammaproteobacteria bacterium]